MGGRHARLLLRRIALGLPILAAPAGGLVLLVSSSACTCTGGSCGQPFAMTTHAIDATQRAALANDAGDFSSSCRVVCLGLDGYGPADGGLDGSGSDGGIAGAQYANVTCSVASAGGVDTLTCSYAHLCVGGRAPSGLAFADAGGGVAGWLARAAYLERASVPAFDELGIELALHGAPARLVRAAARAAQDERRHARTVAGLAARRGGAVPEVRRARAALRDLRAMAADNAVEGCVREAYAALVAARQARWARDADVRAAYAEIAADEARHALLSFAIHDWALEALPPGAARDTEAQRQAVLEAWRVGDDDADADTRGALGLPDATEREALLRTLA